MKSLLNVRDMGTMTIAINREVGTEGFTPLGTTSKRFLLST